MTADQGQVENIKWVIMLITKNRTKSAYILEQLQLHGDPNGDINKLNLQ